MEQWCNVPAEVTGKRLRLTPIWSLSMYPSASSSLNWGVVAEGDDTPTGIPGPANPLAVAATAAFAAQIRR